MPEWITDPRAIAAILTAIGGAGYWISKVDSARKSVKGFDEWKGAVDADREAFKTFMQEVRADLKQIRSEVGKIFLRLQSEPVVQSGSPLNLTEYGEKLSAMLRAKEWVAWVAPKLLPETRGMTPYEVQDFCQSYIYPNMPKDLRKRLQAVSYEEGLTEADIVPVLWVELRDQLLELSEGQ